MDDQDHLTIELVGTNPRAVQITTLRAKVFAYRILGSIRYAIATILRSLPLLRNILRLPSVRIHSLQEWVTEAQRAVPWNERRRAPCYRVVRRPLLARKSQEPHCVAGNERADQIYPRKYDVHPELFLASIPQGRLLGPSGVAITPDNSIVEESAWVSDGWLEKNRAVMSLFLPKPEALAGQYFTIASFSSAGYAHWILDALPRLSLLPYLPRTEMKIIVSNTLKSWQAESLSMLGIDLKNLIPLDDRYLQLEVLHLPSYIGEPGSAHPFACRWLRKNFVASKEANDARRRLYITRRLARRRVINESELEPILERYGFEVIEAEKLGFGEQVCLFSQAEVIAGPHGAGLTNIVFAPPTCSVFELFAETCVRAMYYQLAGVIGQSYWYLPGTALPNPQHNDSGFDDMQICPDQFEQTLIRMLEA
jgi:hypothetical protein